MNTYTTGTQREPAAAFGPTGELLVVWESEESSGNDKRYESVQTRRFDALGVPLGSEFQVNSYTTANQIRPRIATDSQGNFIVVWENVAEENCPHPELRGRLFSSDGLAIGNEQTLDDQVACFSSPLSLAATASDEFLVSWARPEVGEESGGYRDVFARRLRSDATPVGPAFRVNDQTANDQYLAGVVGGPEGQFVVVWRTIGSYESASDIQARRLSTTPNCAVPITPAAVQPTATDALGILQASVATIPCELCACDVDSSGTTTSTDALITLRAATGLPATRACPACF